MVRHPVQVHQMRHRKYLVWSKNRGSSTQILFRQVQSLQRTSTNSVTNLTITMLQRLSMPHKSSRCSYRTIRHHMKSLLVVLQRREALNQPLESQIRQGNPSQQRSLPKSMLPLTPTHRCQAVQKSRTEWPLLSLITGISTSESY